MISFLLVGTKTIFLWKKKLHKHLVEIGQENNKLCAHAAKMTLKCCLKLELLCFLAYINAMYCVCVCVYAKNGQEKF